MKKYSKIAILCYCFFLLGVSIPSQAQLSEKEDYLVTMTTSLGTVQIILYDNTSEHKKEFVKLIKSGKLNGTSIFRSVNKNLIQGGVKSSQTSIHSEIGNEQKRGTLVAMGSVDLKTKVKSSHIDQFYIVTKEEGLPLFKRAYSSFGEVVTGMDIIDKIANLETNADFTLKDKVEISFTVVTMKKKKITKLTGHKY